MANNPNPTPNHDFPQPSKGSLDGTWGDTVNDELTQRLEERVEIRDVQSNLGNYTPYEDAAFRATDTGRIYLGDGSAWNAQNFGTSDDPVPGTSHFEALEADESRTNSRTVTLNVPTDFDTVSAALDEISALRQSPGLKHEVNIESGHNFDTQVVLNDKDLRHVTIVSEDPEVDSTVDLNQDALIRLNGTVGPKIGCVVNGDSNTNALTAANGSLVYVKDGGFGFKNFRRSFSIISSFMYGEQAVATGCADRGLSVTDGSRVSASGIDCSGAGDIGVRAGGSSQVDVDGCDVSDCNRGLRTSSNGTISAPSATGTGCTNALSASAGGNIFVKDGDFTNATGRAIDADDSRIVAENCDFSGTSLTPLLARCVALIRDTKIHNSGGRALQVVNGSTLAAGGLDVDSANNDGVKVTRGVSGDIRNASITNSSGVGITIENGSSINMDNSTITGSSGNDVELSFGSFANIQDVVTSSTTGDDPHTNDTNFSFNTVSGNGIGFAVDFET